MDADAIALHVANGEPLGEADWNTFAPGEARALASDVHDGIGAVLVIRRYRNDDWSMDIAPVFQLGGVWTTAGSSGGSMTGWPPSISDESDIGPVQVGWTAIDEDGVLAVAGLVHGDVASVELEWSGGARRVPVGTAGNAFVIAVRADDGEDFDAIDIRALSADGSELISTLANQAEREALEALTVGEALRMPNGSEITVHGALLARPGETPLLCDEVEGNPPRPKGAFIALPVDVPFPPTEYGDGWTSTVHLLASGVLLDGSLRPSR